MNITELREKVERLRAVESLASTRAFSYRGPTSQARVARSEEWQRVVADLREAEAELKIEENKS